MRYFIILCVLAGPVAAAEIDVAEMQASANVAIGSGEYDSAIEMLEKALAVDARNPFSHYLIARAYIESEEELELAQTHLDMAAEFGAQPQPVAVLRSRAHALTSQPELAITIIQELGESGFAQLGRIEDEPDFDSIRTDSRFQKAVAKIRASRFPCEADERHHAFDFWVGDWTVTQNGQFAGTNNIQSILGKCLIFEQWESASGSLGKSFNYYDPGRDHWRQIWISDSGSVIEFTGEARDGGIYFTAETVNPADGAITYHRFEFTQLDGGTVRQFWATSSDQEEWTTIWDGHYERK